MNKKALNIGLLVSALALYSCANKQPQNPTLNQKPSVTNTLISEQKTDSIDTKTQNQTHNDTLSHKYNSKNAQTHKSNHKQKEYTDTTLTGKVMYDVAENFKTGVEIGTYTLQTIQNNNITNYTLIMPDKLDKSYLTENGAIIKGKLKGKEFYVEKISKPY